MAQTPYAELHCHTNFSFLDGASAPDDLVERAVELGLTGLAVTDHNGPVWRGPFRRPRPRRSGLHPVVGLEIELLDPAVADPDGIVVPARRARRRGRGRGRACRSTRRLRSARRPPAARRDRGPAGPAPADARPAARSSRAGQGGPARDRRAGPRAAPRPARPIAGRLAEPVPARLAREHGRDQGGAALQPGAPRRAHRGARRAVGLPRRRAGPAAADGRPGRGAGRRGALRDAVRARRRSGHERLLHRAVAPSARPTTTGSCRRRRRWPRRSASRSSSPTTSTTPAPRIASWRTS